MKKTVLIVDKDKDILNLYKNMINWDEYGYEILATVDMKKTQSHLMENICMI